MSLNVKSNSLKRLRSDQESRPSDPRQKRNHTEWAVCLTGFSLEDTTARDLKQWVAKVLHDGDMLLENFHGNPVTSCQLKLEEGNAYVEFRCEAEHRHFVNLQQATREGYGTITIQNWEDRNLNNTAPPAPSSPNRDITEGTDDHASPSHEVATNPLVIFLHVPKLFHQLCQQIIDRLNEILQQEKFVVPTEQAFTSYSIISTEEKEGLNLEVRTTALAEQVCFCNGKIIELWESGKRKRICLRLSRDRNYQQLPMDWYSYRWKFHGRPDINGRLFLRASLACSDSFPLGLTFAADNEQRFETMINQYGLAANCDQPSLVAGCWAMRDSRMSYDFLVMTNYPKASSIVAALKVCDGLNIEWNLCHQDPTMDSLPCAGENPQVPRESSQFSNCNHQTAAGSAVMYPANCSDAPTTKIPKKAGGINFNVAVSLSTMEACADSIEVMEIMEEINRVMQQEKFVKPNERAIVSYLQPRIGKSILLEARSELVAEKLCLCNGMLITFCDDMRPINSSGFCVRLWRRKGFTQAPMDWYAYYLNTYRRPVPGCESIVRLSLTDPKPSDPAPVMFVDLLRRQTRKRLDDASSFRDLLRREANKHEDPICRCLRMRNCVTGYDYLVITNSPDTVGDLISMSSCGGIPISWNPCHLEQKLEKHAPSMTPMKSQANEHHDAGNQYSSQEDQLNGCTITTDLPMKRRIPDNVSLFLSFSKPQFLAPLIDGLNTIMKEERFVEPNERAVVACHHPYHQPMSRWCILEACTEQVAERLCLCTGKLIVLFENTARSTLYCIRICRHRLYPQMQIDWQAYISQCRHHVPDRFSRSLLRATLTDQGPWHFDNQLLALLRGDASATRPGDETNVSCCWSMRDSRVNYDYLVLASSPKAAELLASVASYGGIHITWSFCWKESEPAMAALEASCVSPVTADISKNMDVSPDGKVIAKNHGPFDGTTSTLVPVQVRKEEPILSPEMNRAPATFSHNGNPKAASENGSEPNQELTRMRQALSTLTRQCKLQTIELSQSNDKLKVAVKQRIDCQSALALVRVDVQGRNVQEDHIAEGLPNSSRNSGESEKNFSGDLTQIRQVLFKVTHQYKTQSVEFSQAKDRLSQIRNKLKEESAQRTNSQNEVEASRSQLQERDRQFGCITEALTMLTNQQLEDRTTIRNLNEGIVVEKERHRSTKTALKDLILKGGTNRTRTSSAATPTTTGSRVSLNASSEARAPSPVQSSSTRVTVKMEPERERSRRSRGVVAAISSMAL